MKISVFFIRIYCSQLQKEYVLFFQDEKVPFLKKNWIVKKTSNFENRFTCRINLLGPKKYLKNNFSRMSSNFTPILLMNDLSGF